MAQIPQNISYEPTAAPVSAVKPPALKPPTSAAGALSPLARYTQLSRTIQPAPVVTPETAAAGITYGAPLAPAPTEWTKAPISAEYGARDIGSFIETLPKDAQFVSLPEKLGGGQFIDSSEDPNKIYRSQRSYSPMEKKIQLGGLSSNSFEVDHIIPLWLGGADTPENKTPIFWKDHDQKTKEQEVVRSLYASGKLSEREALAYAMNWKNYVNNLEDVDPNKLVELSDGSYVMDPVIAEQKFKEWTSAPKVSFWDVLKGMPAAVEPVAAKAVPPWTREFAKQFTSALTGGWVQPSPTEYGMAGVPGTEFRGEKEIGMVIGELGGVAGAITGMMGLNRILGAGLGTLAAKTGEASKVGGLVTRAANFFSKPALPKVGITDGAIKIANNFWKPVLHNVAIMDLFGQLSRQQEGGRGVRLATDTAMALAFSLTPLPSLKTAPDILKSAGRAVAIPGFVGYIGARMAGADQKESIKNGLVSGALWAMGGIGQKAAFETAAREATLQTINTEVRGPLLKEAGLKPKELLPPARKALPPLEQENYLQRLDAEFKLADNQLYNQVMHGVKGETVESMTQKYNSERQRLILSYQFLKDELLYHQDSKAWGLKKEADWKMVNPQEPAETVPYDLKRQATTSMNRYIEHNTDEFGYGERKTPLPTDAEMKPIFDVIDTNSDGKNRREFDRIPITGVSAEISPPINANLRSYLLDRASGKITSDIGYVATEPEARYIMSRVNQDEVAAAAKEKRPAFLYNPDENLVLMYRDEATGEFKYLGHAATEGRIEGRPLSFNDKIREINAGRPEGEKWPLIDQTQNNSILKTEMDKDGLRVIKVRISPPIDFGKGAGIGVESNQPWANIQFDNALRKESIWRNQGVDWTDPLKFSIDEAKRTADLISSRVPAEQKFLAIPYEYNTGRLTEDTMMKTMAAKGREQFVPYLGDVRLALEHGSPEELRAAVDTHIGDSKQILADNDVNLMLKNRNAVTMADLLPMDPSRDNLLEVAYKKGVLNASGENLINNWGGTRQH